MHGTHAYFILHPVAIKLAKKEKERYAYIEDWKKQILPLHMYPEEFDWFIIINNNNDNNKWSTYAKNQH